MIKKFNSNISFFEEKKSSSIANFDTEVCGLSGEMSVRSEIKFLCHFTIPVWEGLLLQCTVTRERRIDLLTSFTVDTMSTSHVKNNNIRLLYSHSGLSLLMWLFWCSYFSVPSGWYPKFWSTPESSDWLLCFSIHQWTPTETFLKRVSGTNFLDFVGFLKCHISVLWPPQMQLYSLYQGESRNLRDRSE